MRHLAAILPLLPLVSPLSGQTPHPPTADSLHVTFEHHPLGIASELRATDTYRLNALPADSVWLGVDGWWYPMRPGREAETWFVVVPDFRVTAVTGDWVRWPKSTPRPSAQVWLNDQRTELPLASIPARPGRD
mgnify:CR=1 FL=1